MAQRGKALVAKPINLSSNPGTQREEEVNSFNFPSDLHSNPPNHRSPQKPPHRPALVVPQIHVVPDSLFLCHFSALCIALLKLETSLTLLGSAINV